MASIGGPIIITLRMKGNIKNNELPESQSYVPAGVKVIEVITKKAILSASNPNSPEQYDNDNW